MDHVVLSRVLNVISNLAIRIDSQAERIRQLENRLSPPSHIKQETVDSIRAMKEASVRAQVDTAPMRSDVEAILTMTAFLKRLLHPEEFAYAVTKEVRNEARRALGIKEFEV